MRGARRRRAARHRHSPAPCLPGPAHNPGPAHTPGPTQNSLSAAGERGAVWRVWAARAARRARRRRRLPRQRGRLPWRRVAVGRAHAAGAVCWYALFDLVLLFSIFFSILSSYFFIFFFLKKVSIEWFYCLLLFEKNLFVFLVLFLLFFLKWHSNFNFFFTRWTCTMD